MWVYNAKAAQQAAKTAVLPDKPQEKTPFSHFSDESVSAAQPAASAELPEPEAASVPPGRRPAERARHRARVAFLRLCVGVYGAGLAVSGILLAFAGQTARRFLAYYGSAWIELFAGAQPLHLFSILFLTGLVSATAMLLLGLCAFGAPLIYTLLMAKGLGTGLLSLEFFLLYGGRGVPLYILLTGFADAYLALALCILARPAMQNASALLRCCRPHGAGMAGADTLHPLVSRTLFQQYLVLCALLIAFCGVSVMLAQLAGQVL